MGLLEKPNSRLFCMKGKGVKLGPEFYSGVGLIKLIYLDATGNDILKDEASVT